MRILIPYRDSLRKFVVVESSDRDGSLTFIIRRDGSSKSHAFWSTRTGEQEPREVVYSESRSKGKRITIHQSGRVNYHENGHSIFIEPLTLTTQNAFLYGYRVPSFEKLDLHVDPVGDDDFVFDLSDLGDGPVSFSVFICPIFMMVPIRCIKLDYDVEGYSIVIAVEAANISIPSEFENCFITIQPERGSAVKQLMTEEQALLSYHQAVAGKNEMFLYSPNGDGDFRLIFSVPKRIVPKFRIELVNPEYYVREQDVKRDGRSERVMLKFKVRNRRTEQIIREEVEVKSIELDAEI